MTLLIVGDKGNVSVGCYGTILTRKPEIFGQS